MLLDANCGVVACLMTASEAFIDAGGVRIRQNIQKAWLCGRRRRMNISGHTQQEEEEEDLNI